MQDAGRSGGPHDLRFSTEEQLEPIICGLDNLAHLWSRPVAEEVRTWKGVSVDLLWIPTSVEEALALLREHDRLFLGGGEPLCPPYESRWHGSRRSAADLQALYRSLGLELVSPRQEVPDHLSVELEAMAFAMSSERTSMLARRLFVDHVALWVPSFCRAVVAETDHYFYRELGDFTLGRVRLLSTCFNDSPG